MTPKRLLFIEGALGLAIAAECIVNAALRGGGHRRALLPPRGARLAGG